MRISEVYAMCSNSDTYVEVYQKISSTTKNAYPLANYVWTALMNKTPNEIPRFYQTGITMELSVKQWIKKQTNGK